jgi:hypothetical protein
MASISEENARMKEKNANRTKRRDNMYNWRKCPGNHADAVIITALKTHKQKRSDRLRSSSCRATDQTYGRIRWKQCGSSKSTQTAFRLQRRRRFVLIVTGGRMREIRSNIIKLAETKWNLAGPVKITVLTSDETRELRWAIFQL